MKNNATRSGRPSLWRSITFIPILLLAGAYGAVSAARSHAGAAADKAIRVAAPSSPSASVLKVATALYPPAPDQPVARGYVTCGSPPTPGAPVDYRRCLTTARLTARLNELWRSSTSGSGEPLCRCWGWWQRTAFAALPGATPDRVDVLVTAAQMMGEGSGSVPQTVPVVVRFVKSANSWLADDTFCYIAATSAAAPDSTIYGDHRQCG